MITILSTSLAADSNSRVLAQAAHAALTAQGEPVQFIDLRDFPLPLCDGDAAYQDPQVLALGARLRESHALIVATPIYNYDVSAALKNLVELTGRSAWEDKVVSFLCAAGGSNSYMSIMAFANSLMLDFRTVIVPRFVYATGRAVSEGRITDDEIAQRVVDLAQRTRQLARAMQMAGAA